MKAKIAHSLSAGLIIVLMLSLLLSACAQATSAPTEAPATAAPAAAEATVVPAPTQAPATVAPAAGTETQIVVADNNDIAILDPQKMQSTTDEFVWHTVFAGLTRFDATMANPTPEIMPDEALIHHLVFRDKIEPRCLDLYRRR